MADGILGSTELTPAVMQHILTTIVGGFPRVLESHPEEVVKSGLALKAAMDTGEDVETALKNILLLNEEWKQLSIDVGVLPPDGPAPAAVCGGACIFLGGVVVGMLIEKLS